MCNNLVAVGSATADGSVIFGKNSDRAPNEAQLLEKVEAADHSPGSTVTCTYVEVPQAEHTYGVILSRPCWMWGAEMGTNEHGLTIGNTAVFTKVPYEKGPGLTGMDLLRLALERARTSREALDVIVELLETFGQSGNCGFRKEFYYHNSFVLADTREAWILETVGRHWIAEKVRDVRATSNTLTITTHYDLKSENLVNYAEEQGWHKPGQEFDFKKSYGGAGLYTSYLWTLFGRGDGRQNRLTFLLEEAKGHITAPIAMRMLRDHGPRADRNYSPSRGLFGNCICMHTGPGPIRTDQTTGSMVSQLVEGEATHWVTGTSAPCTGVFKPLWFDAGLPSTGTPPTGQFNLDSLWWKHERLHREVLKDYPGRIAVFGHERDDLEAEFAEKASGFSRSPLEARRNFSRECFQRAAQACSSWHIKVRQKPETKPNPYLYRKTWQSLASASSFYYGDESGTTSTP